MKFTIRQDGTPIYQQIIRQVKFGLASGKLKPGDELPAIRKLADILLINPNTIARAYKELEITGIVETRQGGGTRIAMGAPIFSRKSMNLSLEKNIDTLIVEADQMGLELEDLIQILRQRFSAIKGDKQ